MINKYFILRVLYLPLGLVAELIKLALDGSRDFFLKTKYSNAHIQKGCIFSNDIVLGENTHVLQNCILQHTTVGKYTYIGKYGWFQNSQVGNYCSIAPFVICGLGSHPIDYFSTSPIFYKKKNVFKISLIKKDKEFQEYKKIIIGNDVWIGARVIILDGVQIGDGCVIAAGSVVTKNVEPYSIVAGVPAKLIRKRFKEDTINELINNSWYDLSPTEILKQKSYI